MSRIESSNVQLGSSYVIGNVSSKPDTKKHEEELMLAARAKAEEIINAAKAEAAQIIEAAQVQGQEIMQNAHQEGMQSGFNSGYEEGFRKVHEDLVNQVKNVDTIANAAFNVKKEIIASSEQEILNLTLTIAEKVIRQKLDVDPESILNIIRAAINALKDKEEVRVLVNPALTHLLYEFSEELKATIKGLDKVKIIEDRTIPADGAIVESPDSRIDARLSTQISEITRQIMLELSENPAEMLKEIEIKIQEPPVKE